MSNHPPFTNPFHREENDFSFPIEAPNDPNNKPLLDHEGIRPSNSLLLLPNTCPPTLDYQDLSMFLDVHDHEENLSLMIGHQFPTTQETAATSDWVAQLEHIGLNHVHQQGADRQGSCDGTLLDILHRLDHDQAQPVASGSGGARGVREGSSSSMKKVDQNAKEKMRRMKLNDFYLKLRSVLPQSQKAKEKWTAPYIVDRAMEYIPRLQSEIEKLTLEKNNMLSVLGNNKQVLITSDDVDQEAKQNKQTTLTVSINEIKRGEVIVQICQQIKDKVHSYFSTLLENLEGEGIHIVGASSLRACEDRSNFHLHLLMGEIPVEANSYVADLHKKLISWLS